MPSVSWDVTRKIQKRHLKQHYLRPRFKHLTHTGIDEITISKGHRYLIIVLDPKSGAVVFAGDEKGSEALLTCYKRRKFSRATVEAIDIDKLIAYISAVNSHVQRVQIVFDHFHILKLYNETPGLWLQGFFRHFR